MDASMVALSRIQSQLDSYLLAHYPNRTSENPSAEAAHGGQIVYLKREKTHFSAPVHGMNPIIVAKDKGIEDAASSKPGCKRGEDIVPLPARKRCRMDKECSQWREIEDQIPLMPRNPPLSSAQRRISSHKCLDILLQEGVTVGLSDGTTFLQIIILFEDILTGQVHLRGHAFRHKCGLLGPFASPTNEVNWILDIDQDDCRDAHVQSMHTVSADQVISSYHLIFKVGEVVYESQKSICRSYIERADTKILLCSTQLITTYKDSEARNNGDEDERAIIHLQGKTIDGAWAWASCEDRLRRLWRGATSKDGAQRSWLLGEEKFVEQEACSNNGETCCQPLYTNRRFYMKQEAMNREAVASILVQDPLNPSIYHEFLGFGGSSPNYRQIEMEVHQNFPFAESEQANISDSDGHDMVLTARPSQPERPIIRDSQQPIISSQFLKTDELQPSLRITTCQSPSLPSSLVASSQHSLNVSGRQGKLSSPIYEYAKLGLPDSENAAQSTRLGRNGLTNQMESTKFEVVSPIIAKSRYTFGDCFCGGGGMSRGAISAGLRVSWGFDKDFDACSTFARNFFAANTFYTTAEEICSPESKVDLKVDICHISPPCQPFSTLHTRTGQYDDENRAALLSVGRILDKTRPRVVILEETDSLEKNWKDWFGACLQLFLERGFSLRYKTIVCADFGVPQRRPRLFIIAACPGEPLPSFPKPTHSCDPQPGDGLRPWTSINSAISQIPENWPNHNPVRLAKRPRQVRSGEGLAACVTTNGGLNVHPSGLRNFTHREYACLQGFPLCHKFGKNGVLKQIGNAVAPPVAKAILDEVVKTLRQTDANM